MSTFASKKVAIGAACVAAAGVAGWIWYKTYNSSEEIKPQHNIEPAKTIGDEAEKKEKVIAAAEKKVAEKKATKGQPLEKKKGAEEKKSVVKPSTPTTAESKATADFAGKKTMSPQEEKVPQSP